MKAALYVAYGVSTHEDSIMPTRAARSAACYLDSGALNLAPP